MEPAKIWLSSPHMAGSEQEYIRQAFEENWVAPLGPNLVAFEDNLESYLGNGNYVAALSSGTAAIHLALILLGVGRGDVVICSSFTFAASANPIIYQGAEVVFIDSEPDGWGMCPDALENAIKSLEGSNKKPKAIICVHLYGMPFKYKEIAGIAEKYGIPIIEDSAEALGSKVDGKNCGTLGDISILSFNGNKIITTSGGGALVGRNDALKKRAIFLATQARDAAPYYQHSEIGYNYRMSNICAGIGRGQMEVLDSHVAKRRAMHTFYKKTFDSFKYVDVLEEYSSDVFSNFWLTTIVVDEKFKGISANYIRLKLQEDNIEARPLWKPLHLQPVFKNARYYGGSICESLFNTGLCLPSGSNLTEADRNRIFEVLIKLI